MTLTVTEEIEVLSDIKPCQIRMITRDFLYERLEVPDMNGEYTVRRTKLLQARLHAEVYRLGVVAMVVDFERQPTGVS